MVPRLVWTFFMGVAVLASAQSPTSTTTQPEQTAPQTSKPQSSQVLPDVPSGVFLFGGYGKKVDASVCLDSLFSASAKVFDYHCVRFLPVHGKAPTMLIMPGVATYLRTFFKFDVYALGQVGGGTVASTNSVIGAFALGGVAIRPFKNGWMLAIGVDVQKDAGGKSFQNYDFGIGWHPASKQ